jgi:hypothetical protein
VRQGVWERAVSLFGSAATAAEALLPTVQKLQLEGRLDKSLAMNITNVKRTIADHLVVAFRSKRGKLLWELYCCLRDMTQRVSSSAV